MKREAVDHAWQDRDALILAMPSSRGGVYLIRANPLQGGGIEVTHACPATSRCWHQNIALETYRKWRWWEPAPEKVLYRSRAIVLNPGWDQIPVPGVLAPDLEAIIDGYAEQECNRKHIA